METKKTKIVTPNPKVAVAFRVTQTGKNPFSMEHTVQARAKLVTISGLAQKTGYALADGLLSLCNEANAAKIKHGNYITSFRPKAVFKIEVAVNGVVCFHALQAKGLDAIRLVDGKGKAFSRNLIVDKMMLIAKAVESANHFAQQLNFAKQVEDMVQPSAPAQTPELVA